jgi:hypothetical protein
MTAHSTDTSPEGVVPMNESHASPAPTAVKEAAVRQSGWTGRRIASLAIGVLLSLAALALLAAGGTGLWADTTQRSGDYVTTDAHTFSTAGSALATEPTDLGSSGIGWLYSPGLLDKVRIRVTPTNPGPPLFVGVGRSADVNRYLDGVNRTVVTDFFGGKSDAVGGGRPNSTPGKQRFWVASTAGPGARSLVWDPKDGSWTVVVMNADARPGIDVKADLGARMPDLLWITIGLFVFGALLMAGGALLIAGAFRGRSADPTTV